VSGFSPMWYDMSMTVATGETPPPVLPGEVIQPAAILDANSVQAHAFANVLRAMVKASTAFKDELSLNAALDAIDAYEKRLIPIQDRQRVISEFDESGREDITLRNPGRPTGAWAPPSNAPQLDYEKLAKAILLARQEAGSGNS
jgi:hypothetical protein